MGWSDRPFTGIAAVMLGGIHGLGLVSIIAGKQSIFATS
jgi:hypothetical protein